MLLAAWTDAARLQESALLHHGISSWASHRDDLLAHKATLPTYNRQSLPTQCSNTSQYEPHSDTQDTAAQALLESPMARLKCSMSTAVFLTSELYTSEPTIGQKGTLVPSS